MLRRAFDESVEALSRCCESPFTDCEVVVINGEGTLHHDRTGSYLLLGWAALAKRRGLPVAIVNCTIHSFDPFFFSLLGELVDWLAVREPCSLDYVRPFYPHVRLAADAIFASPTSAGDVGERQDGSTRVAYTPGVLSYDGDVNETTIRTHLESLRGQFDEVEFLSIEVEDEKFEAIARELGCPVHSLGSLDWNNVEATLAEFDCLVSGRYHVCIFGLRARVPVVPLHSNTWKMLGLMRFRRDIAGREPLDDPLGHDTTLAEVSAALRAPDQHSIPVLFPRDFDFAQLARLAEANVAVALADALPKVA